MGRDRSKTFVSGGRPFNHPSVPAPTAAAQYFRGRAVKWDLPSACRLPQCRVQTVARGTEQDVRSRSRSARASGRRARRAGLTQQQLAGDRYTKAYVSALETGIARPSMVALRFLAERLALPPSHFLDEQTGLDPPCGRYDSSRRATGRRPPMATRPPRATIEDRRAEVLRGRAEALARLDSGQGGGHRGRRGRAHLRSLGRISDEALLATGWPTASTCPTRRPMRRAS